MSLLAVHTVRAQEPSPRVELVAATSQIRAGDSVGALFTLNRAVRDVADQPAVLARVHAYRAWAYVALDQPERAQAAVRLALKADATVVIDPQELTPPLVVLFDGVRHPSRDPEAAGETAAQAGRVQDAFLEYLNAFQLLADPPPPADDGRLREKIITVVRKLPTKLIVPPEALERVTKATDLLNAEAVLGLSVAMQQSAAAELRHAVRLAPWWPDATFQLATVLQKLQLVDEALLNLNLYKLADPAGYTATLNRANPKKADTVRTAPEPNAIAPAVIYMYFPRAARGVGVKPKVLCDGQHVADLPHGHFIMLNASPGFHQFEFKGQKAAATFGSGLEHYIRVGIEGYPAHFALRITDPVTAVAEMREKQVVANDVGRTFSTECKTPSAATTKFKK